jgi:hypothetical protein
MLLLHPLKLLFPIVPQLLLLVGLPEVVAVLVAVAVLAAAELPEKLKALGDVNLEKSIHRHD